MGIIYKATNKINNHFYIGQTRCKFDKRKREHIIDSNLKRDKCPLFHKAIRDFGKENFDWEIIFESSDQWELDKTEQHFIINWKPEYNLCEGGNGTYIRSDEEREKHSKIAKEQFKNGRVAYMKGRTHSSETRKKISENHADFSGENNPNYGKKPRPWMDGEANPSKSPEVKLKQQRAARKRPRDKFGRFIRKEK